MKSDIFLLDFSRIELLLVTLIPVVINLFICFYVSIFFQRTRVTSYFSFYLFFLGMWQFSEGMIKLSLSSEAAGIWNRIAILFVLQVTLFGLLFALSFTKIDKRISWNYLAFFIIFPVIMFTVCITSRIDDYIISPSDFWNWVVFPKSNFVTSSILVWISLGSLSILFLLIKYYLKKGKTLLEDNQSLLLLVGFSIPALVGVTVEIAFPLLFKVSGVPVTATLSTIFSIMTFVAISKYHMLDFSPKHQWEDIVNSMGEGILIVNNNDEIKYANEAFCKLSGYEFFEMEGKSATLLFASETNNKEIVQTRIEDRKQNISSQYEIQITTKNGDKKWLLVGGSPYKDKDGNVIGSIGIHADINDRKIAEQNLISSNSELEIFVYKASHDLRGPLASIIGLVNVSNYEIKDEVAKEYMNMIGTSTQKLDHTLKELVKTMKIKDTSRFDDKIDFNKLIQTKLGEFKYFNGYDNLTIAVNVSLDKDFYSNNFLLETIFQNLIENAIKYQNDTQSQSFLKIDVVSVNNKVQIVFEDNGIGIKSSVQGLIFDMYYKAVESSKGSGLGLYLVKKCVEKLEGKVELRSFAGKGSTFTITLMDSCEIEYK